MLFSFAIWIIWKSRNQSVFFSKAQKPNLASDIVYQTTEFMYYVSSPRNLIRRVVITCRWERPPEGWIKLNFDGCVAGSLELAGCGGVM